MLRLLAIGSRHNARSICEADHEDARVATESLSDLYLPPQTEHVLRAQSLRGFVGDVAVAKCPGNNNRSILRFDGVIPVRVEIIEVVNRPWSLVKRWSFLWQSALCQQQQRYNQCAPKNDLHPIAGVGFMLGVRPLVEAPFSDHHRLVWQFVAATCVRGKVFRKFPRYRVNPLDYASLELASPEIIFHVVADLFPALRTDMGINAAVGDDFDVLVGEQQINQDAVVLCCVPDPQMRENIERAPPRRLIADKRGSVERALHDKAHLAGMGRFARLDCVLDARQHLWGKDASHPPGVLEKMLANALDTHPAFSLPTSRGAATTKAASAAGKAAGT